MAFYSSRLMYSLTQKQVSQLVSQSYSRGICLEYQLRKFFTPLHHDRFGKDIATGSLPDPISHLLSSARLIALPKQNGDVRPIAVGDVLQRLTARYLCCQFKGRFKDHFSPIQHDVATGGGIELVANHVKLTLESHHNCMGSAEIGYEERCQ